MATGRVPTTANSPLTAKGDLFGYSTTQARVPVGNDGETIVADSSTSTGLRWQGNYAAGKNAIINGDFNIWQRGTSINVPNATFTYGPDRMQGYVAFTAGTASWSRQTFTPGSAPVAGYEGTYFGRLTCGSTTSYAEISQRIENVQSFAGQTITFSFWAKSSASLVITPYVFQNYGSGGSAQTAASASNITLTTSWTRYTGTMAVPSIAGKTIGTSSFLQATMIYASGSLNSATIDVWGWQLEAGNTATAFQTASGTIQGELAACQRYYVRFNTINAYNIFGTGINTSTTASNTQIPLPVQMRTAPSAIEYSTLGVAEGGGSIVAVTSATFAYGSVNEVTLTTNVASGLTQYRPVHLFSNNSTSSYLGFSAEL